MAKPKPLSVCSGDAIRLVLELAQEHAGHVRLSFREHGDRLEVVLLADTEELAGYFAYLIDKASVAACATAGGR